MHPFLIDVIVIFSRVLGPIQEGHHGGELDQLMLLVVVFSAAKGLYKINGLFDIYSSALHTSLARIQGFSLIVTTHKSTALNVNGMTEDAFIYNSFWSKKFFYLVSRHKEEAF